MRLIVSAGEPSFPSGNKM